MGAAAQRNRHLMFGVGRPNAAMTPCATMSTEPRTETRMHGQFFVHPGHALPLFSMPITLSCPLVSDWERNT
jgi:hypothetical protein